MNGLKEVIESEKCREKEFASLYEHHLELRHEGELARKMESLMQERLKSTYTELKLVKASLQQSETKGREFQNTIAG